ncbi:phosphoribosyl 1,2-cyclic phosphate phosphodiesterase [Prosthecobacter fusiformis]|uniref:Phosphoribosyl 1,2-cyclic phosphate phosphodiesterase n=1 Tax=Prosthecobacter fusiformis TaxID=48464 RepID=A0A4R7RYR5_9BACT|nr:MBL fold metallo-hydrolase [Prosthecobacter fusiformis]TDU71042.1 phosphoribosyl 1,2-cyclic phosphate phosphodiesterase [Prosthecobacter fusiformis]
MSDLTLTFLGTGTSVGIPMIGCGCETCRSTDPRDNRLRSSLWMQTPEMSWVVDTGPDFRTQCLRAGILHLEAALFTHPHMDHLTGFDDLRRFTVEPDQFMPIFAMPSCLAMLERMFEFAFNGENRYRGYLKPFPKPIHGPFPLGDTWVTPLPVQHGKVETIGYLFTRNERKLCAYFPDAKVIPPESLDALEGVDTLILDALRHTEHPTHMNFAEALAIQARIRPRRTYLTHLQCEIMHSREEPLLPPGVKIAYDGLELTWEK